MRQSALRRYALQRTTTGTNPANKEIAGQVNRRGSIVTVLNQTTIPTEEQRSTYDEKQKSCYYYRSRYGSNSVPCALPKLEQQIAQQEKKALQNICVQKAKKKMKFELVPIRKPEPIRLMKRSSSSNSGVSYLSLASSRRKPTDQLFSQIENIRLVERLLLARPTKENSKSEHQMFYKQQNKYRKNIQLSKSVPFKSKKISNSRPWINT